MIPAHLHLLLNHVPVLGTAFGLLLLAWGVWRKSAELKKAALGAFTILAVLVIPVYLSGEPAEDLVKGLPGVSLPMLEQHEEVAAYAFFGSLVTGALAAAGLVRWRGVRPLPTWFVTLMLGASLAVGILMAWTASEGGQVRHSEIRPQAAQVPMTEVKDRD